MNNNKWFKNNFNKCNKLCKNKFNKWLIRYSKTLQII